MMFSKNRLGLLGILASLALGLTLLNGCSGKDGKNGLDGTQGPVGPSGTAECMQCHTDDYSMQDFLLPTVTDFDLSQHHNGSTYQRSTNPCSKCHTNEGYQMFVATGQTAAVTNSSSIGCFTCHAPHTNHNFTLRKSGPTALELGGTYDKGESNTCAMCHQARTPSPAIADTSALNSHWGPHHGPQASVLLGTGAYDFGQAAYAADHTHNTIAQGCVTCHMAATGSEKSVGRHTFRVADETGSAPVINSNGCTASSCHPGKTDAQMTTKVNDRAAAYNTAMGEIKTLLVDKGWLDDADEPTAPGPKTAAGRGALFNYLLLTADRSNGVHNPVYIDAVLDRTKTQLEAMNP